MIKWTIKKIIHGIFLTIFCSLSGDILRALRKGSPLNLEDALILFLTVVVAFGFYWDYLKPSNKREEREDILDDL